LQNNTFSGLFIGQKIVVLPMVDSTNDYLKKELSKSAPLPEGTVILAEHQFAGRGQINNSWETEPGKNLTFSILLNPSFLAPDNQFILNKAISIAINDVMSDIIGDVAKIKWPNDIYVNDSKLGGILIENIIQGTMWKHAIVGIGININQTNFAPHLKNVTSLKKNLHQDYEINTVLEAVCKNIEVRYLQLKAQNFDQINRNYLRSMYRLGEMHLFRTEGIEKAGKIIDVNERGLLHIEFLGNHRTFGFKEIEFVI